MPGRSRRRSLNVRGCGGACHIRLLQTFSRRIVTLGAISSKGASIMFTIHALLVLFVVLCIVGLILWGINQIPGIPQIVKVVIYVIVGICLLLWVLQNLGGSAGLSLK